MSEDVLIKETKTDIQWYEDDIPIRGCHLTLPKVKAVYRELQVITKKEGESVVGALSRPEGIGEEEWAERCKFLKDDAFRITVSIIGFDGQSVYGETEEIFDSNKLPSPIKNIFFTNTTAFKRHSSGNDPVNRFSLWINFDKPPLFDPNPLVSEPTPNYSRVEIRAEDVGYFRAVQNIIGNRLRSNKRWYWFIHEKFAYDVGLWFVALPYALYWVSIYSEYLFPVGGKYAAFRVGFFIYGLGISLLVYRALFGYIKWAYPVNILGENKDRATGHRVVLGTIVLGLLVTGVTSVIGTIAGL